MADNRLAAMKQAAVSEAERILHLNQPLTVAEVQDADEEFSTEAVKRYGSPKAAIQMALQEIERILEVEEVALAPHVVGSRYSHEKANEHARLAHLHLSAAIAMDEARSRRAKTPLPAPTRRITIPWYAVVLGALAMIGGSARW